SVVPCCSSLSLFFLCTFAFSSFYPFFLPCSRHSLHLYSFPTRRSSDLNPIILSASRTLDFSGVVTTIALSAATTAFSKPCSIPADRKSTRLNSSHVSISYAVFCLKQKINRISSHRNRASRF